MLFDTFSNIAPWQPKKNGRCKGGDWDHNTTLEKGTTTNQVRVHKAFLNVETVIVSELWRQTVNT